MHAVFVVRETSKLQGLRGMEPTGIEPVTSCLQTGAIAFTRWPVLALGRSILTTDGQCDARRSVPIPTLLGTSAGLYPIARREEPAVVRRCVRRPCAGSRSSGPVLVRGCPLARNRVRPLP